MVFKKFFKSLNLVFLFASKITFIKIINAFLLFLNYWISSIFKIPQRKFFPFSISIEPTNLCNLKCPECPVGNGTLKRKKGFIDLQTYKIIIEQSKKFLLNLFLYFQGEPFLNKNIFEMIKIAHQNKIFTALSTNGHYLNEETNKRILQSGLDYIIISVDGTTQATYEKYRVGGNLQLVLKNIQNLIMLKKKSKSLRPFIEIQFLVLKTNENQINEIKNLAKKLGVDKLSYKSAQIYTNFEKFLPLNKKYSRYKKQNNKWVLKKKLKNRCWRLWNSVVITWEGDVLPCCYDKDGKYSFGNIKNQNLKDLINNEKFKNFASKLLKNRQIIDICTNCGQ